MCKGHNSVLSVPITSVGSWVYSAHGSRAGSRAGCLAFPVTEPRFPSKPLKDHFLLLVPMGEVVTAVDFSFTFLTLICFLRIFRYLFLCFALCLTPFYFVLVCPWPHCFHAFGLSLEWKSQCFQGWISATLKNGLLNSVDLLFSICIFIKILFIYLFLERRREGGREGEKHVCVVASLAHRTGDLALNPGMSPDWESNRWPFGLQAGTQFTEPHQPGL